MSAVDAFARAAPPPVVAGDLNFAPGELWSPPEGCCPPAAPPCRATRSWFVDLLYWTVREGAADNWAQIITPMASGSNAGTATLVDAPFKPNAGFRVGTSQQRDDGYDVTFYYTHFNTNASNQAAGEVYSAFLANFYVGNPDGIAFGPHYRSAAIDWDFQFHTLDLEIGRTLVIDQTLTLRPFAGLKAAVINQSIHSTWDNPIDTTSQTYLFNSAVENLKQDFWGIGPSL
ncbi:MAG TPA: Lpg1974 family pore-forming outer membrane protein, partial [Pirellulales bacterium]|nr:Lpg1974 family pore-forming outer membrane protein [Pirellulales bacterium]